MPFEKRIRHLWLPLLAADIAALASSYGVTFLLRFKSAAGESLFTALNRALGVREHGGLHPLYEDFYAGAAFRIIVIMAAVLSVLYALNDLYPGRRFLLRRMTGWKVVLCNIIALGLFYGYFYLEQNLFHPRSMFASIVALNIVFTLVFRAGVERFLDYARRRWNFDRWSALVVGSGPEADELVEGIDALRPHGLRVAGRLPLKAGCADAAYMERVRERVRSDGADVLVVAEKNLSVSEIMQFIGIADTERMTCKVLTERLGVLVRQAEIPVDMVGAVPLFHFGCSREWKLLESLYRVVSLFAAVVLFLVLLPVGAVISLLILVAGGRPVFFVQERIGINRRPFTMYKFRTMHTRAEEMQAEVEELNESGRGLFKVRRDPRVTPVGRLLRKYSLDELPQIVNVLRGEMGFIGPRPLPKRDFNNYYEKWHYARHSDLPGMTCLWQVSGRSALSFENMCILDVYYLMNRTWVLDAKIILRTIWVVLFARGAY